MNSNFFFESFKISEENKMRSIIAVLIGIVLVAVDADEYYTSIERMTQLVTSHAILGDKIMELIDPDSENHDQIESYLFQLLVLSSIILFIYSMIQDYKLLAHHAYPNPKKFVGNPINSFLLIKQLTIDLDDILEFFDSYELNSNSIFKLSAFSLF